MPTSRKVSAINYLLILICNSADVFPAVALLAKRRKVTEEADVRLLQNAFAL